MPRYPRIAQHDSVRVEIFSSESLTDLPQFFSRCRSVMEEHFAGVDESMLSDRLHGKPRILMQTAMLDGTVCGFKIGYEDNPQDFYSWLGAVSTAFQGLGVARNLMDAQYHWCVENGYQKIKTKTLNHWKNMLILNLKNGFVITNTYLDKKNEIKIVLERDIRLGKKPLE